MWPRAGLSLPLPSHLSPGGAGAHTAGAPQPTRDQDRVLLELGGGRGVGDVLAGRLTPPISSLSFPSSAPCPHPNLHFNLTIPGDLQERATRPCCPQQGWLSLPLSLPLQSGHSSPSPRLGSGVQLAWRRRRWPHREGLTAAQASTMSRDLCPSIVYNRRLFHCPG